jgi:uncharacterized protein
MSLSLPVNKAGHIHCDKVKLEDIRKPRLIIYILNQTLRNFMASSEDRDESKTSDKTLQEIKIQMIQKHNCHTVILYGSRARGEFNATSDYDIIAIREKGDIEKDCRVFGGSYLDAFIYSEDYIKNPDISLIRIKDGIVLTQKGSIGDKLLNKIIEIFRQGPEKTPLWEKQEIVVWLPKMLTRSKREDIEGNYRRHWLLYELLHSYFRLWDLWYLGPKESFSWLKKNDPEIYKGFDLALKSNSDYPAIEDLIDNIIKKHTFLHGVIN